MDTGVSTHTPIYGFTEVRDKDLVSERNPRGVVETFLDDRKASAFAQGYAVAKRRYDPAMKEQVS